MALAVAGALVAAAGPAAAPAAAVSTAIVPGKSMAGINLGLTRAQVERLTGGALGVTFSGPVRSQRGRGFYSQLLFVFLGRAPTSRLVGIGTGSPVLRAGLIRVGADTETVNATKLFTCKFWNPVANSPDPNPDGTEPQHCVWVNHPAGTGRAGYTYLNISHGPPTHAVARVTGITISSRPNWEFFH